MARAPYILDSGFIWAFDAAAWAAGGGKDGAALWSAAFKRHKNTSFSGAVKEHVPWASRKTWVIPPEQMAAFVTFILPDSRKKFFSDAAKVAALIEITKHAASAEAERNRLAAIDAAQRAEAAEVLAALPPLVAAGGAPMELPTKKIDGRVFMGLFVFLQWLGLPDPHNIWNNWLRAALTEECGDKCGNLVSPHLSHLHYSPVSGSHGHDTPLVDNHALGIVLRLVANHNSVTRAVADEAYRYLMRVKVGDKTLLEEIAHNSVAAAPMAREFVLGELTESDSPMAAVETIALTRPLLRAVQPRIHKETIICMRGSLRNMGLSPELVRLYCSDVANELVSLKCKETEGTFARTKSCKFFKAHKYLPEDAGLFKRAVRETISLLSKRAAELHARTDDSVRALCVSVGR